MTNSVEKSGEKDVDTPDNGNSENPQPEVRVGSYVQWTSNGQDQFATPQKVEKISDDGEWAFLEGRSPGVPMNEVSVAVSPSPSANAPNGSPPTNPLYKPAVASGPRIEFPLPGDNSIQIQLKKPVSKKTFERIKQLVALSEESLVDEGQLGGQ